VKRRTFLQLSLSTGAGLATGLPGAPGRAADAKTQPDPLRSGFLNPPDEAKSWVFWWWINGYVSRDGLVRDLDAMKQQGISGAIVFHAGRAETPESVHFMSDAWRELFRFAVDEAAKRGITISLNLCDGWNAGGPWIDCESAAKNLTHRSGEIAGGQHVETTLAHPAKNDSSYHDIAVLAWRIKRRESQTPVCERSSFTDLSAKVDGDGRLVWDAPAGEWLVVRFGWYVSRRAYTDCTVGGHHPETDPLDASAMDRHFAATAQVVMADVAPHVGKTFQHVHIDSGEIGHPDWTPRLPEAFEKRRGYDPRPYLAAKAEAWIEDADTTRRFQDDYDRTVADLMVDCYYGRLNELARQHGLGTHSEAAGHRKPTVNALESLGCNDISMAEFWGRIAEDEPYIHQLSAFQLRYHDAMKTAACAARAYNRPIVQGEAYTLLWRPNFDRGLFALKDIGDRAFCAGLNRNALHHFLHQADEDAKPGYVWPGTGMEFSRHVTWWPMSHAWLGYLARCQSLLQRGRAAADMCYLANEAAPFYVPASWAMDPPLPGGFACDMLNVEALVHRARVNGGRLELPGGASYRYLVLWQGGRWHRPPGHMLGQRSADSEMKFAPATGSGESLVLSPSAMRKLKQFVDAGLTVIGPPPSQSPGLSGQPSADEEVRAIAAELWGTDRADAGERRIGQGRVIWGKSIAAIARADGVMPDLAIKPDAETRGLGAATLSGIPHPGTFDWIHRASDSADIYFLANLRNADASGTFTFRVSDRRPEVWDPVTGEMHGADDVEQSTDGRVSLSLSFAPRQSWFVVFGAADGRQKRKTSRPRARKPITQLRGPWTVFFDPAWGGPGEVVFDQLMDWTQHDEPGVRHYSGVAVYRKRFDLAEPIVPGRRFYLALGRARELAEITLNNQRLGVVWTAPWTIDITPALRTRDNQLAVRVANVWHNRLVLDAERPPAERVTTSNARTDGTLFPSGLLGPVQIEAAG